MHAHYFIIPIDIYEGHEVANTILCYTYVRTYIRAYMHTYTNALTIISIISGRVWGPQCGWPILSDALYRHSDQKSLAYGAKMVVRSPQGHEGGKEDVVVYVELMKTLCVYVCLHMCIQE
jgi:hypothetical protein